MFMKKSYMTLAAVFCCTIVATLFTACEKDVSPSDYYAYDVIQADIRYANVFESSTVLSAFRDAINAGQYYYQQENRDEQMKAACESVRNRYANTVESAYLKYELVRTIYSGTDKKEEKTIGTYELGKALTTPYVEYYLRTNYTEAYNNLEAKKDAIGSDVYDASLTTLRKLIGRHSSSGSASIVRTSAFEFNLKSVLNSPVPYSQAQEEAMKHVCDSIADAHANDTLAVNVIVLLTREKVPYKEELPVEEQRTDIWGRRFNANF